VLSSLLGARPIWSVPAYLDYVHPPVTHAAIARAQEQLGVRLPAAYLAVLRQQNGGMLRLTWPGTVSETLYGIGDAWPSVTTAQAPAPGLVCFDGDGHWFLCMDYRQTGADQEPEVTLLEPEAGVDRVLAPDFGSFVEGLREPEPLARVYGPVNAQRVAEALASVLGAAVKEESGRLLPVPLFRVRLGPTAACWVTANRVVAGYRVVDGVLRTQGQGLQLADDPACVALVGWTPDVHDEVLAALADLPLRVHVP
jgi:hypothetical protein